MFAIELCRLVLLMSKGNELIRYLLLWRVARAAAGLVRPERVLTRIRTQQVSTA